LVKYSASEKEKEKYKTPFDEEKDEPHGRRVNGEVRIL